MYLRNNQIIDLTPLSKFTGLQSLDLSSNKITDLTPLSKFTGQSLYLNTEQITDLAPVYSLRDLEYLLLRHNQLNDNDQIQRLLECFPKLKGLSLSQNSLPIESALLDDLAGLRAYFKDAIKGTTQKKNAKLLFLGDGCVGKTTLLEHLKTLKPPDIHTDERTEGIQLDIWEEALPDFKVNVWDFGGQEVLHSTHRLFLGEKAVYVLVWCKSDNKKCSKGEPHNLQYWLDFVADYGRQSTVFVGRKCNRSGI